MKRALVFAVAVVSLTACSDTTSGSPTTVTTTGSGTTTTKRPTVTSTAPTSDSGSSLAAVKPCGLLDSAAMARLGIRAPGEETTVGKTRGCQWRVDKGSISENFSYDIGLFESLGLADVVGDGNPQPLTVGARKAVRTLRGQNQGCAISIEVSAKSRVDVQAVGADGQKLCAAALDAAKLVEPKLP